MKKILFKLCSAPSCACPTVMLLDNGLVSIEDDNAWSVKLTLEEMDVLVNKWQDYRGQE